MIHNDHLGAPQKMTDASGAVVWAADYKPFGEATITVSTITNNLGFPGQYRDAETGHNYNLNRDYNAAIGRYAEADPMGTIGGENHIFVYADNNPINRFDAEGLLSCDGEWHQYGFERDFNFRCRCYWLCTACNSPTLWSGNFHNLPLTHGNLINSPEGGGAGARRGDACLCDKPGPDKNCNQCRNR